MSLQKMLNTEAIDAQLHQEANLTPFNLYQTFMRNEPRKLRVTSIENLLFSEGSPQENDQPLNSSKLVLSDD